MNQNQPLPPGYIAQWDQNYQRYYFVNTKTGISSWDDPRGPITSYQPTLQANATPPPPYAPTIQNPQYRPANGYPGQYPPQQYAPRPPQSNSIMGIPGGAATAGAAGLALGALGGMFVGENMNRHHHHNGLLGNTLGGNILGGHHGHHGHHHHHHHGHHGFF
ncbi:hypothetical protein HDV04_001501 [Boothiomyces sp. JEL0838]|nr:hypothetical protein HDV04_001501 [Boothiomyces sp. JEL0838]